MVTRSLLQRVELGTQRTLAEYEAVAHLAQAVHELRSEAAAVVPRLSGRTVWMVSSTAQGGGVAEMLRTWSRCCGISAYTPNGW